MAFAITAATLAQIAAATSIATGVAGIATARQSAKTSAETAQAKAAQEELLATQREVERKEELAKAMASQNASAGARGIASFEGSPLTILEADIAAEEKATQRDRTQSQLAQDTLIAQGQAQGSAAKQRARIGLLTSLGSAAGGLALGGGLKVS